MIRDGDNFRVADGALARSLLAGSGLSIAHDHRSSERASLLSPISAALFDDSYRRSQDEIAARKAHRLGILKADLPEYHRLRHSERFKSEDAVAIILRSRKAKA